MSIEAVSWALTVPVGGNQKVVLLGLANHAHPDGTEAYPSLDTLAVYAACDRSTARRNVRKLVEDGWIAEDGFGPRGTTKYRLAMGVAKRHPSQPATGGNGDAAGVASESLPGVEMPPEPSFNRPPNRPSSSEQRAREADQLWEHYLAERKRANPRSSGCRRGSAETRLLANALAVRPLEDCKAAITALFRSDWYVPRGLIGLKYALLGGGRSPDPGTTIDRLVAQLSNGHALPDRNGGGILSRQVWPDGRSWSELTRAEQENAKEAVAMGLEPWKAGPGDTLPMRMTVTNGLTAENF